MLHKEDLSKSSGIADVDFVVTNSNEPARTTISRVLSRVDLVTLHTMFLMQFDGCGFSVPFEDNAKAARGRA